MVNQINDKKGQMYFPFIYALFMFILINNLLGLVKRCLSLFINIFILWYIYSFAVKTPVIFLNTWLLKAHVESPLGGSILLAGKPPNTPALNLAICWEKLYWSISRKLLTTNS